MHQNFDGIDNKNPYIITFSWAFEQTPSSSIEATKCWEDLGNHQVQYFSKYLKEILKIVTELIYLVRTWEKDEKPPIFMLLQSQQPFH